MLVNFFQKNAPGTDDLPRTVQNFLKYPTVHFGLVLLFISTVYAATMDIHEPIPDTYAEHGYAIAEWGIYGETLDIDLKPEAGMERAPLYSLFLAAMMKLDPRYKDTIACHIEHGDNCEWKVGIVPYIQLLMMSAALLLLFQMTQILNEGRPLIAILVCSFAALVFLDIAYRFRLSENLSLPLFALASYSFLCWFKSGDKLQWVALAGLMLGLISLTRVIHIYFIPVLALAIIFIQPQLASHTYTSRLKAASLFTITAVIIVTPWYMRNNMLFDRMEIAANGTDFVAATRLAYNQMTIPEAAAASIYWLPGPGKMIAKKLFPEPVWTRFEFKHPNSYREQAHNILTQKRDELGADANLKSEFYKEMLKQPHRHIFATIPISIRGLGRFYPLAPFAFCALILTAYRRNYWVLGAISLSLITFVLHAGLTHFIPRYGLPMAFGIVPMSAIGLTILLQYITTRFHSMKAKLSS